MNIFVSLVFLFSFQASACAFKKNVQKVISLSGSMTVLLNKTNLLQDSKLVGISIFNPISEKTFKRKVFPGGLFMAQSSLEDFENAVVFFDQGEQIRKILRSRKSINGVEIITRDLLPLEVVDLVVSKLSPYVEKCEGAFQAFKLDSKKLQDDLLKSVSKTKNVIFYLGEIKNNRYPEMIIANDGVVKLLLKEKKINSYPSQLAYVNWSAKVMSELKHYQNVGVHDPGMKDDRQIKKSSRGMTLVYPGSLVPGYSQLEAFLYWSKHSN